MKNFKEFLLENDYSENSLNEGNYDKRSIIKIISALDDNQLNQVSEFIQKILPVYSDKIELKFGAPTHDVPLKKAFKNVEKMRKEVVKAKNRVDILKICKKYLNDEFEIMQEYNSEKVRVFDDLHMTVVKLRGPDYLYTVEFFKFAYANGYL